MKNATDVGNGMFSGKRYIYIHTQGSKDISIYLERERERKSSLHWESNKRDDISTQYIRIISPVKATARKLQLRGTQHRAGEACTLAIANVPRSMGITSLAYR